MAKHKGKDITILQEIPAVTEDTVLIRNADGTRQVVSKKELALEHTQQLTRHAVPKIVKDLPKVPKEHKQEKHLKRV